MPIVLSAGVVPNAAWVIADYSTAPVDISALLFLFVCILIPSAVPIVSGAGVVPHAARVAANCSAATGDVCALLYLFVCSNSLHCAYRVRCGCCT